MRKYIELICNIHNHVREIITNINNSATLILRSSIDHYNSILNTGDKAAGLIVAIVNEEGFIAKSTPIVPEALSFLQSFHTKNSSLINFGRRHVTTSINKKTIRYISSLKTKPR